MNLDLYKPQHQHILNLADALLVCEDEKTLAALQRQFIAAPDASNMADFLRIGKNVVTVDLRLYLRAKTVRRLNRRRPPGQRIPFRSKNSLARSMLAALRPLLPAGWKIYVQFDSCYASEQLIKYVRRQGWYVTCGLKHNRKLNGQPLDQIASALRHRRYLRVQVPLRMGTQPPTMCARPSGAW